jgi:hypothetical protein
MRKAIALWLPAGLFLALFSAGLGFGCTDDEPKMRRPSSDPRGMPDAMEEVVDPSVQPANCPESLPREGETCPTVTQATITCRYAARQCPNGYDVVQSMCCSRGGIWVPCGTYDPCPEGEGTVDAGP